jgi:hypothetical protein
MAYSSFSLDNITETFKLAEIGERLFPKESPLVEPSQWLLETIERSKKLAMISEKVRSELLVMPILLELKTLNQDRFSLFSGVNLDGDISKGLNGECDFILSKSPKIFTIQAPIFCMVEAKKNDIDLSLGQCVAQMLGAKLFNEKKGENIEVIYGCVTTGIDWKFMKLEGSNLTIDTEYYVSTDLPKLLGILQLIVNQYLG